MKTGLLSTALVLAVALPLPAASPPAILNHQGRISVAFQNYEGLGYFKFAFVDGAGTTTYWSNDGTSTNGGEPTAAVETPVALGHYGIPLGDTSLANMTAIPPAVFADNDDVRLRVWFGSASTGPFNLLSPDRRITSAGYALSAATAVTAGEAQTVADNSITAAKLAANAVTTGSIMDGAVTAAAIADGSITVEELATEVVVVPSDVVTINNPDPQAGDFFGSAVASVGADKVLIGARLDDTGASTAGSAYLFDTNGNLLATINNPDPQAGDRFGSAVSSVGADKVLIGAYLDDTGATNAGSAYLFDTNGNLLTTINNPDPQAGDEFGWSVAGVGTDKLLIGAWHNDIGGAIDAGSAYLFDTDGNLLATINNPTPSGPEAFGTKVAGVGADNLLISAPFDSLGVGSAYLFDTAGSLLATINNPDPQNSDRFGWSVAGVGSDKVLIGAHLDDTGALNAGSAYLFNTVGNLLTTISNPNPAPDDNFGLSVVGVGADKLLIGAAGDDTGAADAGSAYLFDTDGNLLATINNPSPAAGDKFGSSVAGEGADKLLIGAYSDDTGATSAGSAYVFPSSEAMPNLWSGGVVDGAIRSASIADGSITMADLDLSSVGLALTGDSLELSEGGGSADLGGYFNDDGSENFNGQLNVVGGPLRLDNNQAYTALDSSGLPREMLKKTVNDETAIATAQNEDITFKDGSNTNMVITGDNGYAGIGEVDPLARLHIRNSDTGYSVSNSADLYIEDADASIFLLSTEGGVTGSSVSLVEVNSGTGAFTDRWTMNRQTTDGSGDSSLNFIYNDGASTTAASLSTSGDLTIAGSLFPTSDRAAKENFREVDPAGILEKVIAMPVTRWNYRTTPGIEHIGPVAQDFHAAFSTGVDDRHISTTDADGVALAAIQGLNEKVEETNRRLREENKMLRSRLENLERRLEALAGQVP